MQAIVARQRAATTEDLYRFSRKLTGIATLDDLLWATAYQVAHMLHLHVVLLLPEGEDLQCARRLSPGRHAGGRRSRRRQMGLRARPGGGARRRYACRAHAGCSCPCARRAASWRSSAWIPSQVEGALLTPDQRRLLDSLSDQTALAIERLHLAEEMDRARVAAETDKLRAALLTSISHDLRTPLASILGSASSLKQYRGQLSESGPGRIVGHHPGRGRAAESLHRQPAGHDAAGIGRADAGLCEPDRSGRCGGQCAAAGHSALTQAPYHRLCSTSGVRPANAAHRSRPV